MRELQRLWLNNGEVKTTNNEELQKEYERLEVTDIRVEQLKDITEQQAEKEGYTGDVEYALGNTAAGHFIKDFKNIYPKCMEDSWLWVIEFKQCAPQKH